MTTLTCAETHEHGAKCYAEAMDVAPMMGAMTWADIDTQEAVMEQTEEVQKLTNQYNSMVNCIVMCDAAPAEKATMLQDAANGYAERVGALQNQGGRSFVDRLLGRKAGPKPAPAPPTAGRIVFTRGKAGEPDRFAMWASNNREDRASETFPAAAIAAAVERFNARDGVKGHVNTWHVGHPEYGWRGYPRELSDWGEIEHAAVTDDGFLLVEGTITRPDIAAGIKAWGEREPLGTSIEYAYWSTDLKAGVYDSFDFDRVSVLPRRAAANQWGPETALTLGKGDDMPFTNSDQRAALATLWGEETVKGWESQAQERAADLATRGVAAKELQVQPPPVTLTFLEAGKDDTVSTADATSAVQAADGGASTGEAAEAVPAWAKGIGVTMQQLADNVAALGARLDQSDEAVKAVRDELANAAPAVGVLGRSVQSAGLLDAAGKELSAQDAAIASYRASGFAPDPETAGAMADWGVAGKIAASFGSMGNGQKPAGQ